MEKAAEVAREQNDYESVALFYTQAAQAFFEAGRPQAGIPSHRPHRKVRCRVLGSEALYKAASKVESARPEHASALYQSAIDGLEQDERFSFGPDLYRSAVSHELKRERYDAAAALLLKFASVCEDKGLNMSVCRSFLGAIVIWLYAENIDEAAKIFRDSAAVDVFRTSEEHKAATALLEAYKSGEAQAVKRVVADHVPFQFLDTAVGRLAIKLPTGDIVKLGKMLQGPEEELEEDLT